MKSWKVEFPTHTIEESQDCSEEERIEEDENFIIDLRLLFLFERILPESMKNVNQNMQLKFF